MSWEEAFTTVRRVAKTLDKLEAKDRARAVAWLVEKYVGEDLAEIVLERAAQEALATIDPGNGAR